MPTPKRPKPTGTQQPKKKPGRLVYFLLANYQEASYGHTDRGEFVRGGEKIPCAAMDIS